MLNPWLFFLFKLRLPVRSAWYLLATLLTLIVAAQSAVAQPVVGYNVTQPNPDPKEKNPTFVVTITDGQKGSIKVTVPIPKTDDAVMKRDKIFKAINTAIDCEKKQGGPAGKWKALRSGDTFVGVTVPGQTGATLTVNQDTTGENPKALAALHAGKGADSGENAFWRFTRQYFSSDALVPAGTAMTMNAIEPNGITLSVSVTGDGVMTADQLQQQVTDQFNALGVTFTTVVNPRTGRIDLVSQLFAATTGETGELQWDAAWETYLGGGGVGIGTEVILKPYRLAFGTVPQGTAENRSVTVTNNGPLPLSFDGIPTVTGTNSNLFTVLPYSASPVTSTCLNGSVALNEGESCTFTVQFTSPTGTIMSYIAYLNINDNGGFSPQLKKMTATN